MQKNQNNGCNTVLGLAAGALLSEALEVLRPKMLAHLRDDILPFWMAKTVQGNPVGHFPTYISQDGRPGARGSDPCDTVEVIRSK